MERINNEYHQIVISKLFQNDRFKDMRDQDKVLKAINIFPEYSRYVNDYEFFLDVLTLSENFLEHKKIQDREDS